MYSRLDRPPYPGGRPEFHISNFAPPMIGLMAISTGIAGLMGLVFIILFFTLGQPFGTLNDIFIGLAAILSAGLAWMLFPEFRAWAPQLSWLGLILALVGALVVVVGSVLVISGMTGWFLAGLYMMAGNALIGLWLLGLSYSALNSRAWPPSLVVLGFVAGVVMTLGLATIPGILNGLDSLASAAWYVNTVGQASALGWILLYPAWCLILGRFLNLT